MTRRAAMAIFLILLAICMLATPALAASVTKTPSTNSALATGWTNPGFVTSLDSSRASSTAGTLTATNYSGYGFNIPAGSSIQGIEVMLEGVLTTGTSGTNIVSISLGNGTRWSAFNSTGDLTALETSAAFGGATSLWGLTWDSTNANSLWMNMTAPSSNTRPVSVDYLAVRIYYTPPPTVTFSSTAINASDVRAGSSINHSTNASTTGTLSSYSFAWNATGAGCDGGLQNVSSGSLSGTTSIISVVQTIPAACQGKTIGWMVYANSTAGLNSTTGMQTYRVVEAGMLSVTLTTPSNYGTLQNGSELTMNATVTCSGNAEATCSTVTATARHNSTATPDNTITRTTTISTIPGGNATFNWSQAITTLNESEGRRPAVDSEGNIIVAAKSTNGLDIYGLIYKLDGNGNVLWNYTDANTSEFYAIDTDAENNIYIAGTYTVNDMFPESFAYIVKLNSSGQRQASTFSNLSSDARFNDVAISSSGIVYACDEYKVDLFVNAGRIQLYDENLSELPTDQNPATDTCKSIVTDNDGNAVYGEIWESVAKASVGKRNGSGTSIWEVSMASYDISHESIAVGLDGNDNIYSAIGGANENGTKGVRVTKFTPEGTIVWNEFFPMPNTTSVTDMAVGESIFITGRYTNGNSTGLLLKVDMEGDLVWNDTFSWENASLDGTVMNGDALIVTGNNGSDTIIRGYDPGTAGSSNPQYRSLDAGESWNVSWTLTSGAIGSHKLDVLTSSSLGMQNETTDATVSFTNESITHSITTTLQPNPVATNKPVTMSGSVNKSTGEGISYTEIAFTRNSTVFNATGRAGIDGDKIVSSTETLNMYAGIMNTSLAAGTTAIGVSGTSGFTAGDAIMVIQMQNASGGIAGQHEFATIAGIAGNTITTVAPLKNAYYSGTFNTSSATAAQVVRVPQYARLTVNLGGAIIATPWNGSVGGIVAIKAESITIIGAINATGRGYRGGNAVCGENTISYAGESYSGVGTQTTSANANGGGAGKKQSGCTASRGAGGGHSTAGTAGSAAGGCAGGSASVAAGTTNLSSTALLGGGGGAGGCYNSPPRSGGTGGGFIYLDAEDISITGRLEASGVSGTAGDGGNNGAGGGGAGGSIILSAGTLTLGTSLVSAAGGTGGTNGGGNGSNGRVQLQYAAVTGSTAPAAAHNDTYVRCMTNSIGAYACTFTADLAPGDHLIRANTTFSGTTATAEEVLTVVERWANITLALSPSPAASGNTYTAAGRVNFSNGTGVASTTVKLYRNGTAISAAEGAYTLDSSSMTVNNYTHITNATLAAGSTAITVADSAAFGENDIIMVIQMQNASGGIAGQHEFRMVIGKSGDTLTVDTPLANTYHSGTFNTNSATAAQVVRVPQYTTVTIGESALVSAKQWDGYSGGIVAFDASGTVTVRGSINATGAGFRGGPTTASVNNYEYGYTGERITGYDASTRATSSNPIANGGGAGKGADGSGAGGGHAGAGTDGGKTILASDYGRGGTAVGNATLLSFGGGGGSAGSHDSGRGGAAGGTAGGIVYINAPSINVTGSIVAKGLNGTNGTYAANWDSGAAGGGGAGGYIYLAAPSISNTGSIDASGGIGGKKYPGSRGFDGGNGSDGRVRIDGTLTGSTLPAAGHNGSYDPQYTFAACATDENGDYSCELTAPSIGGEYNITASITADGYSASAAQILTVTASSCTPPASNNDWTVNAADNCIKTGEAIDLGNGVLTVTGAGTLRLVGGSITARDIVVGDGSGMTRLVLEQGAQVIRPAG